MADATEGDNIFTEEEFKEYFKVDEMYKTGSFPQKTILHFSVEFSSPTDSEGEKKVNSLREKLKDELNSIPTIVWSTTTSSLSGKVKNISGKNKKHAEMLLFNALELGFLTYNTQQGTLDDTKEAEDKKMSINLNIIINYSPCSECAKQIIAFKANNIEIRITFGSFYKIYPDDHNGNIHGLGSLVRNGISLKLCCDSESLQNAMQNIGTEQQRVKRKKQDQEYMKLVINDSTKND